MLEITSQTNFCRPAFGNNNIVKTPVIPESPQDKLELGNKKLKKEEKKSFLGKFGLDIAAFITGVVGIGAAVKTGKINQQLNQKAVSILESVGVKSSSVKSFYGRNIANLEQIENVLTKDALTGFPNRRFLDEYLKNAFNKAKKDGSELHVFMFDIDRFKMVNTALGHDGGDAILKKSSDSISKVVDKYKEHGVNVLFARYGGEEFTLVVDGVPKNKAIEIAQEIRTAVNKCPDLKNQANNFVEFYKKAANALKARGEKNLTSEEKFLLTDYEFLANHVEKNRGFTISAGMCSSKDHDHIINSPNDTLKMADLALESAKNAGRNQLAEVSSDELAEYAAYKLKEASERKIKLPV